MADQHRGNGRGLSRAFTAPVRVVSKVLPRSGAVSPPRPPRPRRSAIIDCGLYVEGIRQPGEWDYVDALAEAQRRDDAFVWLGLHEPDADEFADIAQTFGLHELPVEDAVKSYQRPKVERYGDITFAAVRTARYVEHAELTETSEVVETGDVMLFIGPTFVITVRHGDACRLAPVRLELEGKEELLAQGPWAVFHAVVDRVVDLYLDVAAAIEQDIDEVEAGVFGRSGGGRIQRIYQLKRELVEFKRAVIPLARPLNALVSGRIPGVPSEIRRYIRDVADHLSRTVEQVVTFDDLLNSILQARLAQLSVDMNDDMRKIAAWAAILAVPTAIAGIYGMNFKNMPELHWAYGYYVVLVVMAAVCFGLYRIFRRSGWL
ncbi:magnesium/cobalt transporter CorA [Actinocatenispora rupis]|uniref:Magnesium transport protein CorA n=1 Tax=Actinocatenispora rupis TaxID=519421 RepID=A0A8J3NBB3_9ACTN|nr:magnesium/cobalt transporter CorA [Actinocatenispora rupis]GID13189.1 magnesium transport protein CorA [Actinocatenispora rupis]